MTSAQKLDSNSTSNLRLVERLDPDKTSTKIIRADRMFISANLKAITTDILRSHEASGASDLPIYFFDEYSLEVLALARKHYEQILDKVVSLDPTDKPHSVIDCSNEAMYRVERDKGLEEGSGAIDTATDIFSNINAIGPHPTFYLTGEHKTKVRETLSYLVSNIPMTAQPEVQFDQQDTNEFYMVDCSLDAMLSLANLVSPVKRKNFNPYSNS